MRIKVFYSFFAAVTIGLSCHMAFGATDWGFSDIGNVAQSGTSQNGTAAIAVSSAGSGFEATQDSVSFLSQAGVGDGEVTACLVSGTATAKGSAGVMFRETNAPDSNYVAIVVGMDGKALLLSRPAGADKQGIVSTDAKGSFFKLERKGNEFRAWQSTDGAAWSLIFDRVVELKTNVLAGVFAFQDNNPPSPYTANFSFLESRFLPLGGLRLWLRGDLFCLDHSGKSVAVWHDQSGNGTDATQGDASRQPLWIADDGADGGFVRFDGRDDLMELGGFLANQTAGELFVMFKQSPDAGAVSGLWNFGKNDLGTTYYSLTKTINDDFGASVQNTFPADLSSTAGWQLYDAASAQGVWTMGLNGTSLFTTGNSSPGFSSKARLGVNGQGQYLKGDVLEVLVYDHVLSAEDKSIVGKYFLGRGTGTANTVGTTSLAETSQPATNALSSSGTAAGPASLSTVGTDGASIVNDQGSEKAKSQSPKLYVDNKLGDDQRDGKSSKAAGSAQGPKKSLAAALASLPDGGEIVLQGTDVGYDLTTIDVSKRSITITPVGNVTIGKVETK